MASNEFQPLQGMSDINAPEIYIWRMIEEKARTIFNSYGYEELRTPVLEKLSVFKRSIGDTTDVVKKEMYAFKPGKHDIAMRPEGTAGTIRHLAGRGEEGLNARVFYIASMFRYERPQAGRKRQFHQIGVEATGEANPLADAECIALQQHLLEEWGLHGSKIQISTRGMPSDRKPVADGLRAALQPHLAELCDDCQRRIDENVLRVIDCKNESCQKIVDQIPTAIEFMSEGSRTYLDQVIQALEIMDIEVEVNPKLVRGLDYYVHTVWEITHGALGAQNAIAGGGRYEIALGKKAVPGVGFAMGMERVITSLEACGITADQFAPKGGVWLVSLGEAALAENMKLARKLRAKGVRCGMELEVKSMKAQMRKANRSGAEKAIIRGEDELAAGTVVVKDMNEGSQEELSLEDVIRDA
ncbi:histidine--tRNA ligase [Pontiella sulfatireligans]|uniref:Histidine--tRNA ligase n=1 Tax=Pontiella sulfatireligans TaxID=2750658 RepID=A0A6C2URL2_9BACT|nr:histidine--tRNA ligase [Pontiella sulfatireligans]VGO22970.1 Histidine--tRNA ligase [Pontiella sulfatireligans]